MPLTDSESYSTDSYDTDSTCSPEVSVLAAVAESDIIDSDDSTCVAENRTVAACCG